MTYLIYNQIYKKLKDRLDILRDKDEIDAFGITEAILSVLLLSTTLIFCLYFISLRHSTVHKANLTSAINYEIRRDIEKLKIELWSEHFVPSRGGVPASYNLSRGSNRPAYYCGNLLDTLVLLDSWTPNSWTPGSGQGSFKGQNRNNIFKGQPITITRQVQTGKPLGFTTQSALDMSVAHVVYIVKNNNTNESTNWTSIDLSSEAHSWCPPR